MSPTKRPAISSHNKSPTAKEFSNLEQELFLQPWFVPKATYLAMRRLLPASQLQKLRYYFDDYGCMKCESRSALYGHNGFCHRCSVVVASRVAAALKRRFKEKGRPINKLVLERYLASLG